MRLQNLVRVFLTTILVFSASALAAPAPAPVPAASAKKRTPSAVEIIELRMTRFTGDDSYVEYAVLNPSGTAPLAKASLRCIDRGYDGAVAWSYKELMIFDANGSEIKRKEPRGNVLKETGFSFVFASLDECEKAAPTVIDGSATCTMRVAVDRKLIRRKSEKQAKGTAKLISAECVPNAKAR